MKIIFPSGMNEIKLRQPIFHPDGAGWICKAHISEVHKMSGHGVKSAHSITLRIDEVPKESQIFQELVAKMIGNDSLLIFIQKGENLEIP